MNPYPLPPVNHLTVPRIRFDIALPSQAKRIRSLLVLRRSGASAMPAVEQTGPSAFSSGLGPSTHSELTCYLVRHITTVSSVGQEGVPSFSPPFSPPFRAREGIRLGADWGHGRSQA